MRVTLLAGGWSPERDVSLTGASSIFSALQRLGHSVELIDLLTGFHQLNNAMKNTDFVFINMHGSPGEDGIVQAFLELNHVSHNGSCAQSSIIALNKYVSKLFFRKAGLNVSRDRLYAKISQDHTVPSLKFPVIAKPNCAGSSICLRKIDDERTFFDEIEDVMRKSGNEVLVEEYVEGVEVSCGILGNSSDLSKITALPPILISPKHKGLFDYNSKYDENGAEEICPAPLSRDITKKIQDMARLAHVTLNLDGYSRSDFIIPKDEEPIILEVNTLPGMTSNSLLPKMAAAYGIAFDDLVKSVLEFGMDRFKTDM